MTGGGGLSVLALGLVAACSGNHLAAPAVGAPVAVASAPAQEPDEHVVKLSAGRRTTCALTSEGRVLCWGVGSGVAGVKNGTVPTPTEVDVGGRAKLVAAGEFHSCAGLEDGRVRCWGMMLRDAGEQLGKLDLDLGVPVKALSMGALESCALLETGDVRCWSFGRSSIAAGADSGPVTPEKSRPVKLNVPASALAVGESHACVLVGDGRVRCWGKNIAGQLGYGHTRDIGGANAPDVDLPEATKAIAVGSSNTCALSRRGDVRCWGSSREGRLGVPGGDVGDDESPASVRAVPVGGAVRSLASASAVTCAVLESGRVRCWGGSFSQGSRGQTQHWDTLPPTSHPWDVDVGERVQEIVAGDSHMCALLESGAVRCWGDNTSGLLGYGHARMGLGPAEIGDLPGLPVRRGVARRPAPPDEVAPCDRLEVPPSVDAARRDPVVVGVDQDGSCKTMCRQVGQCTRQGNACVAASDADCAQSTVCVAGGRCTARGGVCLATTDAACRSARVCSSEGRCVARAGACHACSQPDCRASAACRDAGECSLRMDRSGALWCVPMSDAECAASTGCATAGRCRAELHRCVR